MKSVCALILLAMSCVWARATITLNISAAVLQTTTSGQPMSVNGQVLLVASTTDLAFGDPTPGAFVSGDDVVLQRWNLDSSLGDGAFQKTLNFALTDFANLTPNDPLRLYWFPTLDSSSAPQAGTPYGYRNDGAQLDGGAAWQVPADGALAALNFLTTTAGGSNPDSAGVANSTIVPEPSNLITVFLVLGLCALRATRPLRQNS
jgi:hypothetical protein